MSQRRRAQFQNDVQANTPLAGAKSEVSDARTQVAVERSNDDAGTTALHKNSNPGRL
jgi:hypothetical protein